MKHPNVILISSAVIFLLGSASAVQAQAIKHLDTSGFKQLRPVHRSLDKAKLSAIQTQGTSGSTIPLWSYSIVAGQDGNTYTGQIVGRNPAYNGHRTTTVQAYLVPVILTFPDGSVFDPTQIDNCSGVSDNVMDLVQNSPVFQTADYTFFNSQIGANPNPSDNPVDVGTTQYADATQRANYWTYVAPSALSVVTPYHVLIGLNTLPAVSITVPVGYGFTRPDSCRSFGEMDYNWWDNYVENTLIASLTGEGVGPNNLPIFIFDSVVMYLNGSSTECCALGDHGSYLNASNLLQTYVVADFPTDYTWSTIRPDISVLSDEMAKWMNDPTVLNATPPWSSSIGDMSGQCETILELGDPVTGYVFQITPANGLQYNLQEMAYFSWFYDQTPSIGAGGWYSDFADLLTPAPVGCPSS